MSDLFDAAKKGHVDVARASIRNGADVNAVDEMNSTALHSCYAACNSQPIENKIN